MKSVQEIGLKITAAQREYFRYTGASAEAERRGTGTSRPELGWTHRHAQESIRQISAIPPQQENHSSQ
jgi:hypothetical protein